MLHWLTDIASTCPLCFQPITQAIFDGVEIQIEHRKQAVSESYNEMLTDHQVQLLLAVDPVVEEEDGGNVG